MPFDVTAMTAKARFMIRDPSGRAIDDTDVLTYLNLAYDDWWTRFERRPGGAFLTGFSYTANATFVALGIGNVTPQVRVEAVVLQTGSAQVRRAEWNAIRALQESEGAIGTPTDWAGLYSVVSGVAEFYIAFYPIPSVTTIADVFGGLAPSLAGVSLVNPTDTVATDPLTARWITRLASYRMAVALGLDHSRVEATLTGMPRWVKAVLKIDELTHGRALHEEVQKLYRKEEVVA